MGERVAAVVKTLVFTILVSGSVTILVPRWLLPADVEFSVGGWRFLGLPLLALSAVLYLWCAWEFAWTGRGMPAPPDPPRFLVSGGLYRVVRNPMYVAILLILLGESVVFASTVLAWYALAAWAFFHLFVVLYEEPALRGKFGATYEEHRRNVPRWVPRLARRPR